VIVHAFYFYSQKLSSRRGTDFLILRVMLPYVS
jgi:hypothetical protein